MYTVFMCFILIAEQHRRSRRVVRDGPSRKARESTKAGTLSPPSPPLFSPLLPTWHIVWRRQATRDTFGRSGSIAVYLRAGLFLKRCCCPVQASLCARSDGESSRAPESFEAAAAAATAAAVWRGSGGGNPCSRTRRTANHGRAHSRLLSDRTVNRVS